jgi:hypothetical protein
LKAQELIKEVSFLLEEEDTKPTVEEQQAIDLISFSTYCAALDSLVVESYILEESFMDDLKDAAAHVARQASQVVSKIISDAKEFLPKIANEIGAELSDLLKAFKHPDIFSLLKAFGFSLHKMLKAIQAFTGAIRDGLLKTFAVIAKVGHFQKIRSGLMKVDELLDHYPMLKKVSGLAVAGLLLYMWLNMTFIGDLHYDFDWSNIVNAAHGSFSLADLFASDSGLMLLTLFATGTMLGLSVPWLGHSVYNMALAIVYTGFLKAKEHDLAGRVKKLIHG